MKTGVIIRDFPVMSSVLALIILLMVGVGVWDYFSPLPCQKWNKRNLKMIHVADPDNFIFSAFGESNDTANVFVNMLKMIDHDPDILFAVSLGNSVHSGNKEDYRYLLRQIRDNLGMPLLTVVGAHELKGKGENLYQDIFGPLYYSFPIGNTWFIILNDANGQGVDPEQNRWLENQLVSSQGYGIRIVFMHVPLFDPRGAPFHECLPEQSAAGLLKLFQQYRVTHIFASGIAGLFTGQWQGIPYTITGGAGSSLSDDDPDHYMFHSLKINISNNRINVEARPVSDSGRACKEDSVFDPEKILSILSINIVEMALFVVAVILAGGLYRLETRKRRHPGLHGQ
ncbi:hypothetical protein PITCH_A2030068 [uncultured Desulfobacterium sp.]|uniref:Calcineurin-like phosphoesterase domain-containing protein n=1 Tax=uncultured Desulfobacterium sp. TaxID=201089 RepID=A0A445MWL3_9BACT|nr:hypothetical protein PITCH_A2030068 [uncultured Desulfobacterium sp.]